MEASTGDDFPAQGTPMNISRFPTHSRSAFLATVLISPATLFSSSVSWSQTDSHAARNDYVVSVQDLKMASKGRAAFDKGSQMLDKGDATHSITYLERAIAQYPEHYMAYYDLGVAHFRLAHQAEAEQAFQKAIDLTKGTFALPQFGLGAILCQKNEFLQAETLLQHALQLEPGSAVGKYYLAWAQFGLNRLIEAERTLEQALLRNSNLSQAYFMLARIHVRQRNLPAALRDLESFLKLEPHKEDVKTLADRIRRDMEQDASVIAVARP
jgi:tetratricopeptide (TPR) repeat protein